MTVIAITALGLALRVYGIGFGLPLTTARPDETTVIRVAARFAMGEHHPDFFNYPSLYMHLLGFAYRAYLHFHGVSFESLPDIHKYIDSDPAPFHLMSRALSLTSGGLTIPLVFLLSKAIFGRRTALFACLFMAVCHLHVRDSHFGTVDVLNTFLVLCSVFFLLRIPGARTKTASLLAGAFCGLASSAKYGGVFLLAPIAAAHVLHALSLLCDSESFSKENASAQQWMKWSARLALRTIRLPGLWISIASAILCFVGTTPFSLLDFRQFAAHFGSEVDYLKGGRGIDLGPGWWYHLRHTLPYGMGWALFCASICGIVPAFRSGGRKSFLLLLYPVVFFLVLGRGRTVFLRYAIPILPFLCICAACLADALVARVRRPGLVALLAAAILSSESACRAVRTDILLSREDSRIEAARWIRSRIQKNSTVFQFHGNFAPVDLPEYPGPRPHVHPDVILIAEHPLFFYVCMPAWMKSSLRTWYTRAAYVEAVDLMAHNGWYDQIDAFYVPFKGFRGVRRPGPNVAVYVINDRGLGDNQAILRARQNSSQPGPEEQ